MKYKKFFFSLIICIVWCFWGCSLENEGQMDSSCVETDDEDIDTEISDMNDNDLSSAEEISVQTQVMDFVDVYGEHYTTEIIEDVEKHAYDWRHLKNIEGIAYYEDDSYMSRLGIDVSHHQGYIDWTKVKNAGVSFAFIRIGYRGYGETGKICADKTAMDNIKNAQKAGIDVGVYFFSQAINEEEALEEADFVLEQLDGIVLELPVVYDPETIRDDVARTDDVSGEQFTRNTIAFCEALKASGYTTMIYSNMLWEAFEYDLIALKNMDIWYADYEKIPQTPYAFSFWQFTEKGHIDGVDGEVDLDIQFLKK